MGECHPFRSLHPQWKRLMTLTEEVKCPHSGGRGMAAWGLPASLPSCSRGTAWVQSGMEQLEHRVKFLGTTTLAGRSKAYHIACCMSTLMQDNSSIILIYQAFIGHVACFWSTTLHSHKAYLRTICRQVSSLLSHLPIHKKMLSGSYTLEPFT